MEIVNKITEEIARVLQKFYRWPTLFAVVLYEGIDAIQADVVMLWKRDKWHNYGHVDPDFALMYKGTEVIPEEPVELNLYEVTLRHVETREVVFSFLGDVEDLYIYEAVPTGRIIKVTAAKTKNGDVALDTSQLRQYVEMQLQTRRY